MKQLTHEEEVRREMRWKARANDTVTVLTQLKASMPEVWAIAKVVGRWVWITFPSKPESTVREQLCDMGFSWNSTRGCWQHACGVFRHHSHSDPRFAYGELAASSLSVERESEAA